MAGRYEGAFAMPPSELRTAEDIASREAQAAAHFNIAADLEARAKQHFDFANALSAQVEALIDSQGDTVTRDDDRIL